VLLFAIVNRRLVLSRNLAFSGLVLSAVFLFLPRIVFASNYADMRLVPFVLAIFILAIRFRSETHVRTAQALAVFGLAFFLVRTATTTISFAMAADDQRAKLHALDHLPIGARVVTFVGQGCRDRWSMFRNGHIGAMVIVRRQGFSNDQWNIAGSNLLTVKYTEPGAYAHDPSQIARPNGCQRKDSFRIDQALEFLPRDAFDYAWLVEVPPYDTKLRKGMTPVWQGPRTVLYRLNP
jgi:hypothetical protein